VANKVYLLECRDAVTTGTWSDITSTVGDGSAKLLSDTNASGLQRFYRVKVHRRHPDRTSNQAPRSIIPNMSFRRLLRTTGVALLLGLLWASMQAAFAERLRLVLEKFPVYSGAAGQHSVRLLELNHLMKRLRNRGVACSGLLEPVHSSGSCWACCWFARRHPLHPSRGVERRGGGGF